MTISDKESNELYIAATESLISEKSAENCWSKMIRAAYEHCTTATEFVVLCNEVENVIRADFEIKTLPNPWRSAKSVIKGALAKDIPLVDDNGCFMGKSALQKAINGAKGTPKTAYEQAITCAHKIISLKSDLSLAQFEEVQGIVYAR